MNQDHAPNIYLIGFMGTGKTTVGRLLASSLSYRFIDMDVTIAREHNLTISEIFAEKGESFFRKCETDLIQNISKLNKHIIGTGGGVVLNDYNTRLMRGSGTIILLTAQPETIIRRLDKDDTRPLLAMEDKLKQITSLLNSRKEKYISCAKFSVSTDNRTPEQVAQYIMELLKNKAA